MKKQNMDLTCKTILVTGAAGFIGAGLTERLLREIPDAGIVGIDNMNDYYDVKLKEYRLSRLMNHNRFTFVRGSIADRQLVSEVFKTYSPSVVVNLAAQGGVRYSIDHPDVYIESNLIGFYNIIEACRHAKENGGIGVEHLVFASSSSVYGSSRKIPFSVQDMTDQPVSLYAATKKSNELLAYSYSKLYGISTTGLRFFTVYGPAGRPDMFYFSAADRLIQGKTIQIFNYGNCRRDFTYIDDITEGVMRVLPRRPEPGKQEDGYCLPPFKVYNIGGGAPENLLDFVSVLQEELVRAGLLPADYDFEAHKELVPMQPGDVPVTYADSTEFEQDFGFRPQIRIREGLKRFAEWYADYCRSV